MRKSLLFSALLILFCSVFSPLSFCSSDTSSIKVLVLQLEKDLREKRSGKIIEERVKEIQKAKQKLPVFNVPELNYLLKRKVEKVPSTEISLNKLLLKVFYPVKLYSQFFLWFLSLYTLFFIVLHLKTSQKIKTLLLLVGATFLLLTLFFPYYFTAFLISLFSVFLYFSKRKLSFFYLLFGFLFLFSSAFEDFFLKSLTSPSYLYRVKVSRDWYLPEFLIEEVLGNGTSALIEKITNNVSVGSFGELEKARPLLRNLESKQLKGIILNDFGVVAFLKGDYQKAKSYFQKAFSLYPSPIIKYNLYLTRAALFEVLETPEELLGEKVSFTAKGVPLTVHILPRTEKNYNGLLLTLFSFSLGLLVAHFSYRKLEGKIASYSMEFLELVGSEKFVNEELGFFLFVPFICSIVALLISFGETLW